MPAPGFQTLLTLSGAGLPPYSARGLTQTLSPIGQSTQLRRTINGQLRDLSLPQFHVYASTISGDDQRPPYAYKPGTTVTVNCVQLLSFKSSGGVPQRNAVPSSDFEEGEWTFYRPQLVMVVTGWSMNFDEWAAGQSWSMTLEELELPDVEGYS